jgi:hypothetical protein
MRQIKDQTKQSIFAKKGKLKKTYYAKVHETKGDNKFMIKVHVAEMTYKGSCD